MNDLSRRNFIGSSAGLLAAGMAGTVLAQPRAASKTVRIGWTAWSDAEVVTNIAKQIIEQKLGTKVELVMSDIALQYAGLQRGQIDMMLMAWLPNTQKAYWDKVSADVEDLGVLYGGARLGWAVPDYVPAAQVASIEDLKKPEVATAFKSQIQGIDAGSGLMRLSEQVIPAYKLDYKLLTASDAAMVAALDRAIQRQQWIAVTTWTPHWMFSQYQLRFLDDPKKILGTSEEIHGLARKGFTADFPAIASFVKNFKIPLNELQQVMLKARSSSYEKEAAAYIKERPELVNQWLAA